MHLLTNLVALGAYTAAVLAAGVGLGWGLSRWWDRWQAAQAAPWVSRTLREADEARWRDGSSADGALWRVAWLPSNHRERGHD